MLGLGEREDEVIQTITDLRSAGCKILTIGQYLKPGPDYMEVVEYITPEKFEEYRLLALKLGFSFVESSPLVRSSFHAENHVTAQ
jgi:lipoic acid synthetase